MNFQQKGARAIDDPTVLSKTQSRLASLEDVVRTHARKERTEAAVLGLLSVAGVFVVGMMAPNVAGLLARILPDVQPVGQTQSIRRSINRLIRKGYIRKENGKYHITETGSARLTYLEHSAQMRQGGRAAQQAWDGKWRVVVFDVKEAQKFKRDELRRMLTQAGFMKLQNSVWVYPYRCDEVIALLKFRLTLGYDLVYMIADAIEGDTWLRSFYNLPDAN